MFEVLGLQKEIQTASFCEAFSIYRPRRFALDWIDW